MRDAKDSKFQDAMNRIVKRQLTTFDTLHGAEDMLEEFNVFAEKRDTLWNGK